MAKTALAVLDDLHAGRLTLDDVVADFGSREWDASPVDVERATDVEFPHPNSWEAVSTDPRLSSSEYAQLAQVYVLSQS